MFGSLDDGLLSQARVEALAAVDISKQGGGNLPQFKHEVMYHPSMTNGHPNGSSSRSHQVKMNVTRETLTFNIIS
jgi:hypothetical protein